MKNNLSEKEILITYKITKEDAQKWALKRIGRRLSDIELHRVSGIWAMADQEICDEISQEFFDGISADFLNNENNRWEEMDRLFLEKGNEK